MTLPASGLIKFSDIAVELGMNSTDMLNFNNPLARNLAVKLTGVIKASNFYSKAYATNFINRNDCGLNTAITSNMIYVSGVGSTPVAFTISSPNTCRYRIGGTGTFKASTIAATVKDGDKIEVEVTTDNAQSTPTTVTAYFGSKVKPFTATTGIPSTRTFYVVSAIGGTGSGRYTTLTVQSSMPTSGINGGSRSARIGGTITTDFVTSSLTGTYYFIYTVSSTSSLGTFSTSGFSPNTDGANVVSLQAPITYNGRTTSRIGLVGNAYSFGLAVY